MPETLLSIGIPTYNRAPYLRDLLLALEQQIRQFDLSPSTVGIHVCDNASPDTTQKVVEEVAARLPHLDYFRQQTNVGVHRNVMTCVRRAKGKYCWVCGDDELLQPGGLKALVDLLQDGSDPALVVSLDANYACAVPRPARFPSYRDYASACGRLQPHILIEHTLISSNIYRRELFDFAVAEARLSTDYSHMYAVIHSLIDRSAPVFLPDFPLIAVRERRPPFAQWPENLEQSWREYLGWQKEQFDLNELDPEEALEQVRQVLLHKITRHPFQYVWNNLAAVSKPQAWRFILKRLWLHLHRAPTPARRQPRA